jgi:hypothetical protein
MLYGKLDLVSHVGISLQCQSVSPKCRLSYIVVSAAVPTGWGESGTYLPAAHSGHASIAYVNQERAACATWAAIGTEIADARSVEAGQPVWLSRLAMADALDDETGSGGCR